MSMRHEGLLMLTVPIYHSSCNRRRQLVQLLSNRCPAVSLTEGGLFEILCISIPAASSIRKHLPYFVMR